MRQSRIVNQGSKFIGTTVEFNRYVGGYLRNYVQKTLSPKYKKQVGHCEDCGSIDNLQAAHIHGRGRQEIMKEALEEFVRKDDIIELELHSYMEVFHAKHMPLHTVFRVLCKPCHDKYDEPFKKKKESKTSKKE